MSVRMRQHVERAIAWAFISTTLKAGLRITVNDGEEDVLKLSKDGQAVMRAMFSTDEDHLYVHKANDPNIWGRVDFVYGNDPGTDVISDYTINLEPYMNAADAVSDYWGGDGAYYPPAVNIDVPVEGREMLRAQLQGVLDKLVENDDEEGNTVLVGDALTRLTKIMRSL